MNPITGNAAPILDSQGAGVSSTFGIANNSHMFHILSSGLYSDKIGAVLREVSCNAMDAHVEFGCPDKQIQVKLPSSLDKTFYVKDWGPGLDDEQIRQIYTVYGVSTKQKSDDQTGGFGLGSKSPFAYTLFDPENAGGFSVVSVKNGVKRAYVMHLNDAGEPAVTDMGTFPADPEWPHGVMVSFPVQERDFAEFQQKAQEIYQWFRVKPEVLGLAEPIKVPKFRFADSEFFKMGSSGSNVDALGNYHANPAVVMANVRYPIQVERLGKLSKTALALLREGIHFFLPNGEVLMTPNREALQYVDKTRKNILARLEQAKSEMAQRVRADVMKPEKTRLEWLRKVHRYAGTLPYHLKASLAEFLEEAGVSASEVKAVREMLSETTLQLPKWVGDGLRGNAEYKRDSQNVIMRDGNGDVLFTPNTGVRVWRYAHEATKGIRKKEVVHGHIDFNREKPIPVVMSVLGDMPVLYADGPHADMRARGLLDTLPAGAQVLLVQPCRGVAAHFARSHAEAICGPDGIEGLPCFATSGLPIPDKILAEREWRKARKLLSAAELMADEEVKYRPAQANEEDETTLGELDDESDKFYVVKRGERFTNMNSANKLMAFRASKYDTNRLSSLQRMMRLVGIEFSGTVVLSSEGAARRLRLAEQGYRPLLPYALSEIAKRLPELTKNHDRTADIPDLTKQDNASRFGMMGVLTRHLLLRTPAWEALEAGLDGHPLLAALADLALRSGVTKAEDATLAEIRACLPVLRNIENHGLPPTILDKMGPSEVTKTFNMAYPTLDLFDDTAIASALNSMPEKAAAMVLAAIELDSAALAEQQPEEQKPVLALAA
ncbi:ATP-binding protein [Burkholderia cenocepacia]|uniref:ATP-binding protein n=1 Tax=Burkholderia cenocepacia TaxID=95486 RepID=UPI00076CDC7E|nr:ATP-binding protein [Burkholderia cenocepacia]KWU24761.1 hypothetical protein AS149_31955 [Burkholderia cenocepacia]